MHTHILCSYYCHYANYRQGLVTAVSFVVFAIPCIGLHPIYLSTFKPKWDANDSGGAGFSGKLTIVSKQPFVSAQKDSSIPFHSSAKGTMSESPPEPRRSSMCKIMAGRNACPQVALHQNSSTELRFEKVIAGVDVASPLNRSGQTLLTYESTST